MHQLLSVGKEKQGMLTQPGRVICLLKVRYLQEKASLGLKQALLSVSANLG